MTAADFPAEVFWRSVGSLKQPVLLVNGVGLQVLAATDEARELFGDRNMEGISSLLRSGLDPHTLTRIQLAAASPVSHVSELPIRMQTRDIYLNVTVTVSALPEYPEKNVALLFLKRNSDPAFRGVTLDRDVLARLPLPAWVVDDHDQVTCSNGAFSEFPLERLRTNSWSDDGHQDNAQNAERLSAVRVVLDGLPAKARQHDALTEDVIDLGAHGKWRMLHFPIEQSASRVGYVGVIAIPTTRAVMSNAASSPAVLGRDALTQVMQVREAERNSLAREIHDSLGQELTVLKLELSRLYKMVAGTDSATKMVVDHFESVRKFVDRLAKTARRIAFEMKQDSVMVKGLAHSVQELVLELRTRLGAQIQLEVMPGWVEPEQEMAHHMHRSVQEMLNNVSKHAKASRCLVRMGYADSVYWLEVRDDGVGMPGVRKARSIGLDSMTERADIYGGRLVIQSRPDVNGTSVRMELPETRMSTALAAGK